MSIALLPYLCRVERAGDTNDGRLVLASLAVGRLHRLVAR